MKKLIYIFILLPVFGFAQPDFYQSNLLDIEKADGSSFSFPFTGGLKFPVFESIDLNNDGKNDLIVLDRADNRLLTFINRGIKDSVSFDYRPQFELFFPYCESFIRLLDYNNDGLKDIFVFAYEQNAGINVFKNISSAWNIEFQEVVKGLPAKYFNTYYANLYVSSLDLPVFKDMDQDGDVDILTFGVLGNVMELYDNLAIDSLGHTQNFKYEFADACWGKFKEDDLSNQLQLGFSCGSVRGGIKKRHAGSTLELIDYDNDGDFDLLLGDVQYSSLKLLKNGRKEYSLTYDSMIEIIPLFPPVNPVHIRNMPAAFLIDVNNDSQADMISSPMDMEIIDTFDNLNQIWLYIDKDTSVLFDFQLKKKNFLQEDMLDFGGATKPVFFDINADGKKDLIVATKGNFSETFYQKDRLFVFLNTGTVQKPVFTLHDSDYLNLSSLNLSDIVPAFGDIDGDQKPDLVLGLKSGRLMYFKNTAGASQPPDFNLITNFLDSIDVGNAAAPFIYDMDGDGFGDLFIGCEDGTIHYYHNETSGIHPLSFFKVNDKLGNIHFMPGNRENTYVTIADINHDLHDDLIIGTATGGVFWLSNFISKMDSQFVLIPLNVLDYSSKKPISKPLGKLLFPAVGDVNNDKRNDLILGNIRGGLLFYSSLPDTINISVKEKPIFNTSEVIIYPNPASHFLSWKSSMADMINEITIYNSFGQMVYHNNKVKENQTIDISSFQAGVYLIHFKTKNQVFVKKMIKN